MDFLKDGRTRLALGGAVVALVAGLAVAWALVSSIAASRPRPRRPLKGGW